MKETMKKTHNLYQMKTKLLTLAPLLGMIFTIFIFAILTDGKTISAINLKNLSNQVVVTALVAIGSIFAFSCGALDMSLSGCVCVSAIAGAIVASKTGSFTAMIATIVAVSLLIGLAKGLFAAYLELPVFIVTIVLGTILTSIGLVLLGKQTIVSVSHCITISDVTWINVVVIAVFYIFALILFNYTKLGKSIRMQGGNIRSARQSGIRIRQNVIYSFLIGGVGVALAAIVLLLRTKTASASSGGTIGTDIMVAIVLGGMPLSGGPRSKISAALIGTVTICALNNGLVVLAVSNDIIQIIRGVIFLVVVFITVLSYRTKMLPR